jgi:excisionase family DNA binding protein
MAPQKSTFDPLAYIESGFLDTRPLPKEPIELGNGGITIPFPGFPPLTRHEERTNGSHKQEVEIPEEARVRFRRTTMSAPRPRRARQAAAAAPAIDPDLQQVWELLPKNIEFLCSFFDDSVTKNYYRGEFKESRDELVRRLLDPQLTLEETSRLLGVCPATVRRYTNRGWLTHHRTEGGQRRFRLSDIVRFVDEHGRFPEE